MDATDSNYVPPLRLVGLYAAAPGSGKTTAAKGAAFKLGFNTASFAAPVKATAITMVRQFLEGNEQEQFARLLVYFSNKELQIEEMPGKPTMRYLLETIGTRMGREQIDKELWVSAARAVVATARKAQLPGLIFDDVRMMNEAAFIRREGGLLINIVRPHAHANEDSVSEGLLAGVGFDAVVINDGTKEELIAKLVSAIREAPAKSAIKDAP